MDGKKASETYWASERSANSAKGYYEIRYEYTGKGKISSELYFDANGDPMVNKDGCLAIAWGFDRNGNKVNETGVFPEEASAENEKDNNWMW